MVLAVSAYGLTLLRVQINFACQAIYIGQHKPVEARAPEKQKI
jgi:hypothetical protein